MFVKFIHLSDKIPVNGKNMNRPALFNVPTKASL